MIALFIRGIKCFAPFIPSLKSFAFINLGTSIERGMSSEAGRVNHFRALFHPHPSTHLHRIHLSRKKFPQRSLHPSSTTTTPLTATTQPPLTATSPTPFASTPSTLAAIEQSTIAATVAAQLLAPSWCDGGVTGALRLRATGGGDEILACQRGLLQRPEVVAGVLLDLKQVY